MSAAALTAADPVALVDLLAGVDFPIPALPAADLPLDPAAYFASGCQTGEVTGFAAIGHDVGVVAGRVNAQVEAELLDLAGTDIQVFVDSGAFSEVEDHPPFRVVKPIPDSRWRRILALYARLGAVLGDQLHVVAPDQVGSQERTLERLARYAPELRALDAAGVRVLVAVQRGRLPQAEFYRRACEVLGFVATPALPCKKAATSPAETRSFVRAIRPATIHMLGLGPRGRAARAHLQAILDESPESCVTLDSCVVAAHAGTKGNRGHGRRLTCAARLVDALVAAGRLAGDTYHRKLAGVILAFGREAGVLA